MHACYLLHCRCGYVIRTCLKPVFNIIFYHVEFYRLMHRKCVKKQIFYCSRTMPIHTCTCYQSDYQLSPPDWYIQTWSSGTDPPMCMFIQISNSPSQEFLNHGEDFFLSEVSGGLGSIWLCVFCGLFSLCWQMASSLPMVKVDGFSSLSVFPPPSLYFRLVFMD